MAIAAALLKGHLYHETRTRNCRTHTTLAGQIEHWPTDRPKPYAKNPRLHSEADLGKIAASIRKWGWTMPVLVDEHGGLICGDARLGAANLLELESVPVIVARRWSEEEKRAYRIADHQLAARASSDPDLVRDELQALNFADFDLGLTGFEPTRDHPGWFGDERSDRSGQRPGSPR